jgi:hypothetical protein
METPAGMMRTYNWRDTPIRISIVCLIFMIEGYAPAAAKQVRSYIHYLFDFRDMHRQQPSKLGVQHVHEHASIAEPCA